MLRRHCLETLLILSTVSLIGQLAWPSAADWWNRPSPGKIGVDRVDATVDGISDRFVVYLPPDFDHAAQPLVIYLHGAGERGYDPNTLKGSGPFEAIQAGVKIPAVVVGPQCIPRLDWQPDSVARFVNDVASRYAVDRNRIYLVGYSLGGYGTWQIAAAYPDMFAAIVPIAGSGNPDDAESLASMPTWAFHGAKDTTVPVEETEQIVKAIRATGGEPTLTVLPDSGHGICEDVCRRRELWNWLLTNRRSAHSQP